MLQSHPNVLLIVIDALRLDCAGPELMPNLNAIADQSVRFSQAIAQGSSTPPSMTSMLTSTYPLDYGGHWYLADSRKTIAEVLKESGYSTAAIHSNPKLSRIRNFDKGFDWFDENLLPDCLSRLVDHLSADMLHLGNRIFKLLRAKPYVNAKELNHKLVGWIGRSTRPFFLWAHYMDVHGPYLPHRGSPYLGKLRAWPLYRRCVRFPASITRDEKQELKRNYEAEARYADEQLGGFIGKLKRQGLWEDTLVIITADHGEEFGEHGEFTHGNKPYEELIRVPLVVKPPSAFDFAPGSVVSTPVRLMDLFPTVLDIVGIDPQESLRKRIEGKSLVPFLHGDGCKPYEYVITEKDMRSSGRLLFSFRTEEWKFIFDGATKGRELYRLSDDPNEMQNVVEAFPDVAGTFEGLLRQRLAQIATRSKNVIIPEIVESREVDDRLRALGYLK